MKWSEKPSVIKGDFGEVAFDEYLRGHDVIPYGPLADGAHPFDRLCATKDKRQIFIADVKTKAARVYYPDTGIERKHYNEYLAISEKHKLRVFLVFVDHHRKEIYGNWLSELRQDRFIEHKLKQLLYPLFHKNIVYFPLVAMRSICKLTESQVERLTQLSRWSKAYLEVLRRE